MKIGQLVFDSYEASEEKHWIPLFTAQNKETHIKFREALKSNEYTKNFLQHVDDSIVTTFVKERLIETEDLMCIDKKRNVVFGRPDVVWKGKENMTFCNGEYMVHNKDHLDSDGVVTAQYKSLMALQGRSVLPMLLAESFDAEAS